MVLFKGKQFKQDIIMVAVGYNLGYCDISEILRECGISVCHTMFTNGCKNIVRLFIFYEKRVTERQEIHGERMKLILKWRGNGTIYTVRLILQD